MSYSRFAIYYLPPKGPLADFGASWLGWDVVNGRGAQQPDVPGLNSITKAPRKYGFHATLKPPFRLAQGYSIQALEDATAALAGKLAPASCDGLTLTTMGRFLALTPTGDTAGIKRIAAACVEDLDAFRAPLSPDEIARRSKGGLNAQHKALLAQWGYPYVMDAFRFHMTLTARLPKGQIESWAYQLRSTLPTLNVPFVLGEIYLCGERDDGQFELINRFALKA